MLCGVMASPWPSWATMEGEPQKSQRWATVRFTKTEIARQFWHWTS